MGEKESHFQHYCIIRFNYPGFKNKKQNKKLKHEANRKYGPLRGRHKSLEIVSENGRFIR